MIFSNDRWLELEKFVGRTEELAVLEKILNKPDGKQRTLMIQGAGGQGKTWLIKKMLLIASEKPNVIALKPDRLVDMYLTSNRHLEGVLLAMEERIVEELDAKAQFMPYYHAKAELEKAYCELGYSGEDTLHKVQELATIFRHCIQEITKEHVLVLAFDTFEYVQNAEVSDWILSDSGLQMSNLICLIGTRTFLTDDQKKKYSSIQEIHLGGFSDNDAIKLYCSYTGEDANSLKPERKDFIHILNKKSSYNPLILGLAIMYLDLPDQTLKGVERLSQAEFEKQVVAWLAPQSGWGSISISHFKYSEQMRHALILMSYLNRRFNKFFLQNLVDAGYIHLDNATVDELWNEINHRKPDLFFVKERSNGEIQLHDKLAELLRKHVFINSFVDTTGERVRNFVNDVVRWYEELLLSDSTSKELLYAEQMSYLLRSNLFEDCKQSPNLEICAWLNVLAPHPEEIVSILEEHSRKHSDRLARLLIQEAKTDLIERFGGNKKYEIYHLLGTIAEQAYSHDAAQKYISKAYDCAVEVGDENLQIEALINSHNSTFQSNPWKSLKLLDTAERICMSGKAKKLFPKVLYEKGFTYSYIYDLLRAAEWYGKAKKEASVLEDKEMMPIILNDEGYNFLLLGQLIKARIEIRAARDHRHREYTRLQKQLHNTKLSPEQKAALEEEVRNAAEMLGLSYSTLGDLARFSSRLDEALIRYKEAMAYFQYCRSRYWQARMHFTMGEVYRRIAVADYIAGRTQKYRRMDRLAEENIQQSIALCKQYGFRNDVITAYRRLGRLHHDRMFRTQKLAVQLEHLDQAKQYFQDSLAIAREIYNQLEILENLTELAFLGDDYLAITQGKDETRYELEKGNAEKALDEFERYLESSPKDDRIHQFPVFQHLLEIEQAAHYFVLGEKENALRLYQVGYAGMASLPGYGVARYLQHLDHLMKQLKILFRDDKSLGKAWCESFLENWESEGLMESRPEFPQEVATIMETHFLLE